MASVVPGPDHPAIRRAAACHDKDGRDEHRAFLVEGRRAVNDLLAAGWVAKDLFFPQEESPPADWRGAVPLTERTRRKVSNQTTPSGWAGIFPRPDPIRSTSGLILVGIHDPGNAGTLIRAAAAFAWPGVILVGGADPWSPKVVQASAGAIARLSIERLPADSDPASILDGPAVALVVKGGADPATFVNNRPRWLLVGGEANGLPPAWIQAATPCSLPMPGGTESLNAAMAGTLAAYLLRPLP